MTDGHTGDLRVVARHDLEGIYTRLGAVETAQGVAANEAKHTRERIDAIAGVVDEIRRKVSNGLTERVRVLESDTNAVACKLEGHLRTVATERRTMAARAWSIVGPVLVWLITGGMMLGAVRVVVEQTVAAAIAASVKGAP